jgi:hypothetical protein
MGMHEGAVRLIDFMPIRDNTSDVGRERALPAGLIIKIETILNAHGLKDDPITIRMTGCPNGRARPYITEIGLTERAPGKYNLYLGGGFHGQGLNKMYLENVSSAPKWLVPRGDALPAPSRQPFG